MAGFVLFGCGYGHLASGLLPSFLISTEAFPKPAYRGDSLREVPFSHGAFLRHNGARERSIIQLTDLLSHWLSLRIITGTDSSRKQFLDMEFILYIFVY